MNLRNPQVVEKLKEAMQFWLDKKVDGFVIDMAAFLYEADPALNAASDMVSSCVLSFFVTFSFVIMKKLHR